MKDCIENMRRVQPRLEYQIYRQKPWEWDCYDLATQEVGCQYDVRLDDTLCTCRNRRVRRPEMGYYGLPKQIYAYQEIRNFADIGVGSVKALARKKVKKIYLPETDDRGVGSSEMCSIGLRRTNHEQENCCYDHKRTSSKCVGDIPYNTGCVLSKKLSPIIQTRSGTTSPIQPTCNKNQETGSNTVINNVFTKTVQVNTEVYDRGNAENSITKDTGEDSTIKGDFKGYQQPNERQNAAKQTVTEYSSDTLDHNVHNLEYSSEDKLSHVSVDPMENKLEREYRRLFYSRRKDENFRRGGNPNKDDKPKNGRINSGTKSPSVLKRRFEALRRGLAKKDDSKGSTPLDIKASSQISTASHKDVSIASDPPSLESRSYSNMRTYSPFTSILEHDTICDRRPKYHDSISTKKEKGSWQWSKTDAEDSESTGRKGMFKMWGKKLNLEDDYKHPMPEPPQELAVKKGGKKFFFFKKKSKDKPKPYKAKKSVTTGRCEVKDGIVYKTSRGNQPKMIKEPTPEVLEEYGDIRRKAWLKKYVTRTIESRNSVKIRWYNKTYASSSSTVFELMDHVNNKARMIIKSKSDMSTTESYYQSFTRRQVHYIYQNIEAWMVPKTITDRPNDLPVKINVKPSEDERDNIENPFSDHKWFIDKSKAFSHKIELVLHSKNIIQKKQSSDYLRINIPKGFFTELSSYDKRNQSSDEQVYNVVEYETGSEIKKNRIAQSLSTGDHKYNNEELTVDIKNSDIMESQMLETVIKSPTTHRDVVIQDSNVYIPKRCDIIGVGIITQRNPREIRKPILKIRDDVSEEESEYAHRTNLRQSKFAESYLRDYYRYWTPLDMDFYSWCVSDSHLGCCSENSKSTFTNQADSSRSCPNILDDFQSATVVSSCDTSSCSHFLANTDEDNAKGSCCFKLFGKKKNKDKADDGITRVLPKDSIEVCKKRKIYAVSNKCKWSGGNDETYSVPSCESRGAQNNLTDYLKVMKPCCVRHEIKKGFCKKHVSLPGYDAMQKSSVEETGDCLPRIVTVKDPAECGACKEPNSPKNAGVDMGRVAEITQAPCNKSYEKIKEPPCTKLANSRLPNKRSSLGAQPCDPMCPYNEISSPKYTPTKKPSPSPKRTCSPPERLSPVAHKLSPIKKPCVPQCPFAESLSPAMKKPSPEKKSCVPQCPFAERLSPAIKKISSGKKPCVPQCPFAEKLSPVMNKSSPVKKPCVPQCPFAEKLSPVTKKTSSVKKPCVPQCPFAEKLSPALPRRKPCPVKKSCGPQYPAAEKPCPAAIKPGPRSRKQSAPKSRSIEKGTDHIKDSAIPLGIKLSMPGKRNPAEWGSPSRSSSPTSEPREPNDPGTPRESSPTSEPREPSESGTPRESSPTSGPGQSSELGTPRESSPTSRPGQSSELGTPRESSPTSRPGQSSELGTPRESSPTSGPGQSSELGTPRESSPTSRPGQSSELGTPRESSPTSGPGQSSELGTPRESSPTSGPGQSSEHGTPRESSPTSGPGQSSEPGTPRESSPTSGPGESSELGTPREPSPTSRPGQSSELGTPRESSPTSGPGQSSELRTRREPRPTSEPRESSEPGTPRESSPTSKRRELSEPGIPRNPSPTSGTGESSELGTPRESSPTSGPGQSSELGTPRESSPTSRPGQSSELGTPRESSPTSRPGQSSELGTPRESSPTSRPGQSSELGTPRESSPTSGPGQSSELRTRREPRPTSEPRESSEHGTPRESSPTSKRRELSEPGIPRKPSPTSGPGESRELGTPREPSPTSESREPSEPGTPREASPTSEPRKPSEPGTRREPSVTSETREPSEPGTPREPSPTSDPRKPSEPGTRREPSLTNEPREPSEPRTLREPRPTSEPREPSEPGTPRKPSPTSGPGQSSEPGTPRESSPTSGPGESSELGTPREPSPTSRPGQSSELGTPRESSPTSGPGQSSELRTRREPRPTSEPRESSEPGTPRESSPTSKRRELSEPGIPRNPSPTSGTGESSELGTPRESSPTSGPGQSSELGTPRESSPTSRPGQSSELGTPRESSPTSRPGQSSELGTPRESSPTSRPGQSSELGTPRESSPTSGPGQSSELRTRREPRPTSEPRESSEHGTPRESSPTSKRRELSEPGIPRKPSPTSGPGESRELGTPREPSPTSESREPSEPGTPREASPTSEPRKPSEPGTRREPSVTSETREPSEPGTPREPSPTSDPRKPSEPGTRREPSLTNEPREPSEPRTLREPRPTSEPREPSEPGTPRKPSPTRKPRKPSEPGTRREPSLTSEPRESSEPVTRREPTLTSEPREPSEPGTPRKPSPTTEPRKPSEPGTRREPSLTSEPRESSESVTRREPSLTSEPREPSEPGTPRETRPTGTGQFKSGSKLPISPGKPSPAESGSSQSKSRSSPSKSRSSPASKSQYSPERKASPKKESSKRPSISEESSTHNDNSSSHQESPSLSKQANPLANPSDPPAAPITPPKRSRQCCSPQCKGINPEPCNRQPTQGSSRAQGKRIPPASETLPEPPESQTDTPNSSNSSSPNKTGLEKLKMKSSNPNDNTPTSSETLPAGRNSSKPSGGHENNSNNQKNPSLKNSVSVQMMLEKSLSEPNTNIHNLGEKSPGRVDSPEHIPLPSKSKSKLSGIWLKMKQFTNYSSKETKDKCPNYGSIRSSSKENLTIRMKTNTPSNKEIRGIKENMNIKIQDDDGQLYERRDYTAYGPREQHRPSVVGEMYKASNAIHSVHRISTQVVGDAITSNKIDNKSKGKSDASLTNMIEIQFQMKVTQGDKTTEIGIANDEDEKEGKKSFKQPEEVFVVKNDSVHSIDSKDPRNDINIRIVIKNFKPKSAKNKSKAYQDEFCKEITDKFHTVSTGYSDILSDANAKNEFSVHRATVDLTTSSNKFRTEDLQSYEVEACTDTMPIDSHKSVHSANPNESVDDTEKNLTKNKDYSDKDVSEEVADKHTKKGDLNVTEDPIDICDAHKATDNYITDNDDTERSEGPSDFTKGNYFIGKYDYTDIDTEKEDLAGNEDLEHTDDDARKLEEKASSHNTPTIKYVEAKEWKSFQQNYEATISTDTDEHDLILEANTSTDNDTAGSVEVIIKPHTREEKKEMLKEVFEKAHATQVKSNIRMRKFRDMLKAVLTSDSSDYDELKINVLAKNLTHASQKSNYLRDSDSMNNYYNCHPISDNDSSTRPVVDNTVDNNSECSNSDEFSSEEQLQHEECVCSKLAARLNLCAGTGSGCCYCKSVKTVKKDKEIVCDIKSDDNCDFQTNIVDVQTQNSKCFYKDNTSRHNYTKTRIIETCNMVDKVPGIMHAGNERKALRRSFLPHINHIRKCPMKKFNRNTILTIADDDKIVMLGNKATTYDGDDNNDIKKSKICPSDILQSNEAKKAVLEIYAEKTVSEDGEHFVAKLPKFVYNRESEIIMNYEAIAHNNYTAAVCKRNVIRMSIER